MKNSSLYNSIALHDFSHHDFKIKEWFIYITILFEKLSCSPNTIGASGWKKLRKFNSKKSYLDMYDCENFDFMSLFGGGEAETNEPWILYSSVNIKRGLFYLGFKDDFLPIKEFEITNHILNSQLFCNFKYGIAYQRYYHLGPDYYANGVNYSTNIKNNQGRERELISLWMREYFIKGNYKTGLLRDIYIMNFLCIDHLNMPCLAVSLQDWILSSEKHGTLIELNEHIWQWSVPEENIPYVRETLRPTGLILCI